MQNKSKYKLYLLSLRLHLFGSRREPGGKLKGRVNDCKSYYSHILMTYLEGKEVQPVQQKVTLISDNTGKRSFFFLKDSNNKKHRQGRWKMEDGKMKPGGSWDKLGSNYYC